MDGEAFLNQEKFNRAIARIPSNPTNQRGVSTSNYPTSIRYVSMIFSTPQLIKSVVGLNILLWENNRVQNWGCLVIHCKLPKSEIMHICMILVVYIIILTSILNLSMVNGNSEIWISLLCSTLRCVLPSPSQRWMNIFFFWAAKTRREISTSNYLTHFRYVSMIFSPARRRGTFDSNRHIVTQVVDLTKTPWRD